MSIWLWRYKDCIRILFPFELYIHHISPSPKPLLKRKRVRVPWKFAAMGVHDCREFRDTNIIRKSKAKYPTYYKQPGRAL